MPDAVNNNALTPEAAALWHKTPAWAEDNLLSNIWCSHCARATTITDYRAEVVGGDLVLTGTCQTCGAIVRRLIEGV